jgi:lysozyme
MKMLPANRPAWGQTKVSQILADNEIDNPVALLGVRGYYRDSLGIVGRNDRGIYDDAIFLCSEEVFAAFNANVDPSIFRFGIASLQPGLYLYKLGIHGLSRPKHLRYRALVQASEVIVKRDGEGTERGYFGINIHRGNRNSTSSAGCQTIHPAQWGAFIALVESEMKRVKVNRIPYLLIEAQG